MNSVLVSILTQILSAILALFMPFSATAPAISVAVQKEVAASSAVASWDVSDTAQDNVKMYYYEEGDNSFIDNITAAIGSVFGPLTAYAAEEEPEEIDTVDNITRYTDGTIVVEGSGATQKMLFLKWLDYDAFVEKYEEWCRERRIDNTYVLMNGIDEDGQLTGEPRTSAYVHALYENLPEEEQNEAILRDYFPLLTQSFMSSNPQMFWEECAIYTPKHVIIRGDVEEISFGAFAFCSMIEDVVITANVKKIDSGAFSSTNIERIILPESLRSIGAAAFVACRNLELVFIKGDLTNCDYGAFDFVSSDCVIYCTSYQTFRCVNDGEESSANTASENDENENAELSEAMGKYSGFNTVVYNQHLSICNDCGEIYFDLDGHVCE